MFVVRLILASVCIACGAQPLYLDPKQPLERRVEDLLSRMTLPEKIGQMNMPCLYVKEMGTGTADKRRASRSFAAGTYVNGVGPAGGFFTLSNEIVQEGPRSQSRFLNELQEIAMKKTRLGIPLLQTEEGTHGVMASGHTIFPEGLGIGSTWNMSLVRELYAAAAREARSVGIHQLFTLVIEPNRDPRLGRNQEAYSEDPYLCSRIAEAIVNGAQGSEVSAADKVVAGLCHYPGQSQPTGGLEQGAMEVSERTLREVFLPPWVRGIQRSGALGVMATYPAIDGMPAHASRWMLTRVLREELGFGGLVLSEGGGIGTLVTEHLVGTQKEAGILAVNAGVDVSVTFEEGFLKPLAESVTEGRLSVHMIDRAVRRILALKFRLGLFERPYTDPERAAAIVHNKEHQNLAASLGRESIVLLKNEGNLLPLKKDLRRIAVIGPNADSARNQLGDYTSLAIPQRVVTVLDGIREKVSSSTKLSYVRGCDVLSEDRSGFTAARQAARNAQVAVVVVGENERFSRDGGTDGEGRDVASLDLTGVQEDMIRSIAETGTPTVVVLINGRPLSIRWAAEHIPAIVEAWLPGERGGEALADILFGDVDPSGRLPITVPRHAGQLPMYYNFMPTRGGWADGQFNMRRYVDLSGLPLYPFGHGLSYTTFQYRNLRIAPREIRPDQPVGITVNVRNAGNRAGQETVQLYLRDLVSSVTRPIQELKGFQKIRLMPGEEKTVEFQLEPEDLSFLDRQLNRVVEAGRFEVMVGSSSQAIHVRGNFDVKP